MTGRCLKIVVIVMVLAVMLGSCQGKEELAEEDWERSLVLRLDHEVVVPTSSVRVVLGGTTRIEANSAEVTLEGDVEGRDVSMTLELDAVRDGEVGDLYIELDASQDLWPQLEPGDRGMFRGELTVSLHDVLGVSNKGSLEGVSLLFIRELRPTLEFDTPSQLFANAIVEVEGDGLLRPEEGQTRAVISEGRMATDKGHIIELAGESVPVEWDGNRGRGVLRLDPAVIGVHPGELSATIHFENVFSDGTSLSGTLGNHPLESRLETTFIASMWPEAASRGQIVEFQGRGFVPGGGGTGYGMLLRFEGILKPTDTSEDILELQGGSAPEIVPYEVLSDEVVAQDIWYQVVGRELVGLGAMPGVFEGTITPIVYDEFGEVQGVAWAGEFEVLPTKQIVYLKYLPAFSVALDRYGLANVERQIRDRISEVVHRDYEGINIEFVEEPPSDFVAYATIELGGPDPTGGQAFGFDNTFNDQPKDTGNLYIDDYLGGINWETGEEFDNPYGGVFVESFANFSPTIHPEMSHGSENFDKVFGPFMPELGGHRVQATEWPEGSRTDDIAEAIRVFGNVVGNTVGHEMGHALGLTHFPGDWDAPGHRFHNAEPDGCIMDAGSDRSFEQRAELDGEGPAVFNDRNRSYLEDILGK